MGTSSFLELYNQSNEFLKLGKTIKFNIKSRPLTSFRITYGNPYCHITRDGAAITTGSMASFVREMYTRLIDNGYVIEPCNGPFSKDCAYIYLRENDKHKKYPRLKVYVHPNELAGWAPNIHVKKLKKIAEANPEISNVRLVYSCKAYNISDEEYLNILKDAEPQIKDWLTEYTKYYGRKKGNPAQIFNEIFGIKRLSAEHLGYNDYIATSFINNLNLHNR